MRAGRERLALKSNQGNELILRITDTVLRRAVPNRSHFVQLIRSGRNDERKMTVRGGEHMLINIRQFQSIGRRRRPSLGRVLEQNSQ